jgi:hypothetical protein
LLAVAALRVLLMGAAGPVEATPDNRLQVLKSKAMLIALDEHADAVWAARNETRSRMRLGHPAAAFATPTSRAVGARYGGLAAQFGVY